MLKVQLHGNVEVVMNVVYDGCDSIRWLKRRELLDSEVSITIDKTELVTTQEALLRKKRGRLLFVGIMPLCFPSSFHSGINRVMFIIF